MTPHECILACFAIASSGRLEEAKANLLRNRPCLENEEGIDLLARIELRLGNETEARRLWTQAIESGVGGRRSRRALDALDSVEWRHRRLIRNLRRGFTIGIPALLGLLAGLLLGRPSAPNVQIESTPPEQQRPLKTTVESESMSEESPTVEPEPTPVLDPIPEPAPSTEPASTAEPAQKSETVSVEEPETDPEPASKPKEEQATDSEPKPEIDPESAAD